MLKVSVEFYAPTFDSLFKVCSITAFKSFGQSFFCRLAISLNLNQHTKPKHKHNSTCFFFYSWKLYCSKSMYATKKKKPERHSSHQNVCCKFENIKTKEEKKNQVIITLKRSKWSLLYRKCNWLRLNMYELLKIKIKSITNPITTCTFGLFASQFK